MAFDAAPPTDPRIMAYCHDSVGIGHLRRTLAICERVGRENTSCSFLLATGTPYVQLLNESAKVDFIKLPALTKTSDGRYASKYLGLSIDALMHCRKALLLEAARSFAPHLLLVDKAPLGVCRELVPTLRWLRRHRPQTRIIFGMRDIEDDSKRVIEHYRREGVPQILAECYDEIWVYGSQRVYDVVREYHLPDAVAAKIRYQGYIARPACAHEAAPRDKRPTVLVTVGGGTDGERVLSAYLDRAASEVAAQGARSVIVGGPDLPDAARRTLRARAAEHAACEWVDFERCMGCRIRQADLIVMMGGYNTLCEVVSQQRNALVIPRTIPRLEQRIRAELWQRLGLVRMLAEPEFSPAALARHTVELLRDPPAPPAAILEMNGLERVAAEFRQLFPREARCAAAVPV